MLSEAAVGLHVADAEQPKLSSREAIDVDWKMIDSIRANA